MTISFLNKQNNKTKIILFSSYYLIFLSAFYINENSTGGAYQDFLGYKNLIELFLIQLLYADAAAFPYMLSSG